MPPRALKSTRSAANSRVTLISDGSSTEYTSLRRSTRSTTRGKSEDGETKPAAALDLARFAYTSPPRKRARTVKAEVKEEEEELVKIDPDEKPVLPSRSVTPREKKQGQPTPARTKAHPEPPRWREQYALIEKMRAGIDAPVDTM